MTTRGDGWNNYGGGVGAVGGYGYGCGETGSVSGNGRGFDSLDFWGGEWQGTSDPVTELYRDPDPED